GVSTSSPYHNHSNASSDYVAALSGTSMATPVVAGVAATVWSKNPTWTRLQVWDKVKTTADSIAALNPSYSGKLGSGRVNMKNALSP
ncbi:S8 family serine peptidase, partial [Sulfuritalea sp.]|uniref:S8 family serine peptidase n=1 Tax=Sulfuritalea sp. TaxID=2480090 RepID=UPI001ACB014C